MFQPLHLLHVCLKERSVEQAPAKESLGKMKKIVLVACGSFNPITNMHLRIFELARDALQKVHQPCRVVGIVSPVNDGYCKKGLAPASDRVKMIRLALSSSDWIRLDTWEAEQEEWTPTVEVLRHFREVAPSLFLWKADGNGNQLVQKFINHNDRFRNLDNSDNMNASNRGNSWCCNGNVLWNVDSGDDVEVKLLCGADLLQSFTVPNVWSQEHAEEILGEFGVVVCSRTGCQLNKVIAESELLSRHSENIFQVTERIVNEISSTKIREAVERGESIKYLVQDPVIDYIKSRLLYRKQ